jgi:hypothetical protein
MNQTTEGKLPSATRPQGGVGRGEGIMTKLRNYPNLRNFLGGEGNQAFSPISGSDLKAGFRQQSATRPQGGVGRGEGIMTKLRNYPNLRNFLGGEGNQAFSPISGSDLKARFTQQSATRPQGGVGRGEGVMTKLRNYLNLRNFLGGEGNQAFSPISGSDLKAGFTQQRN